MTLDEFSAEVASGLQATGAIPADPREALRLGVRAGMLAFLARERERHADDIREIDADIGRLTAIPSALCVVRPPREHVEIEDPSRR